MKNSGKISTSAMLRRFLKGSQLCFMGAVAASCVSIVFNFLLPRVVGFTVDSVIGQKAYRLSGVAAYLVNLFGGADGLRSSFILCAVGVLICALVSGLFDYLSRAAIAKGTEGFTRRLRDSLFSHVQHLPFSWHTDTLTGDIIQRCTSDVDTCKRFVSQQLIEVVRTVILLILAFVMMFSLDITMALICGGFVPLILAYTLFFYKKISTKFLDCDEAEGELMVRVQENLTGVRVVRAFGREQYEVSTFDEKNNNYSGKWIHLGYTLGIYWGIGDIVSASQLLTVVAAGAYFAATGKISLGTLLIFISYTQTIGGPVRQMGRVLSEMSKTGVALTRIGEIFAAPVEEDLTSATTPPLDGDIEFNDVAFSYGGRAILDGVSFKIPAGSTIGILGGTGSGKSTLTYLLNRLYDLPEGGGSITIGGTDIKNISQTYLRRNVGLVLQEPFLFSKTIFENIDIASRTGDIEKVRRCAAIAAVDEDIMSFPDGYDTVVGERGVTLSGGQKQRIAMARTLMLQSPIMVFDDSMSNLDMETDAKIRDALRQGAGNSTVIIVSHRISTLMQADKIIVLDGGKIVESGTHSELIAKSGYYRHVYELQAGLSSEGGEGI